MLAVSYEKLKQIFDDFFNITQITIVIYDSDRNPVYAHPCFRDYCRLVRSNAALRKACLDCDRQGFDVCDQTRKPYIYKCHTGVTEAIAPIYANDMCIGYLMFGQVMCRSDVEEAMGIADRIAEQYGMDQTLLTEKLQRMAVHDRQYIESALNLMCMSASYLYTHEIIKSHPDLIASRLKDYIRSHLAANLSVESLCRHFYISRSKLYKIASENFGMSVSQYIRRQRIESAEKLLRSGTESVAQIASAVGIPDPNYFSRIFKADVGVTPAEYRKSAKNA